MLGPKHRQNQGITVGSKISLKSQLFSFLQIFYLSWLYAESDWVNTIEFLMLVDEDVKSKCPVFNWENKRVTVIYCLKIRWILYVMLTWVDFIRFQTLLFGNFVASLKKYLALTRKKSAKSSRNGKFAKIAHLIWSERTLISLNHSFYLN